MSAIAQESGLGRESLYKAFAPGQNQDMKQYKSSSFSWCKINVSAA